MRALTGILVVAVLLAGCGDETTINNYYLTPNGAITGWITPVDPGTTVMTADSAHVALIDANGFFLLDSLSPGIYHIVVRPLHYSRREFTGITVIAALAQSLGKIKLATLPYPVFMTKPADGDDSVSTNAYIYLYADEPLNLDDLVAAASFTPPLQGTWQGKGEFPKESFVVTAQPIPGVIPSSPGVQPPAAEGLSMAVGGASYFFQPSEPMRLSTTYHVRIPSSVRTLSGDSLEAPLSFQFATEPLGFTMPHFGEGIMGGVPLWSFSPMMNFNAEVDVDSLVKAVSFTPPIEGIWVDVGTAYRGVYYEFLPTMGSPLQAQTEYMMIVRDDVALVDDLRLQRPDTVRFTTEPYGVIDAYPRNGSRVYNPFHTIGLSFNAEMDTLSLRTAFSMYDVATDTVVTGFFRWAIGTRRMAFDISGDLRTGAVYRYTLGRTAQTASGQALTHDFTAVFAVE